MSSDSEEKPFAISVPDSKIEALKLKLKLTDFPDELEDAEWDYGTPLADVKRLVDYWVNKYDWRKHEAALNAELPQFTRDIEVEGHGIISVHYVHKRSEVVDAIPLLFVHGWPGSFLEIRKILPHLVDGTPSFHVVAISLPGFGFSSAPRKKGFALEQHAETAHKLMLALGYHQYVTQGGDWGSAITQKVALRYGGKHSMALHTNLAFAAFPHPVSQPFLLIKHMLNWYTPAEKKALADAKHLEKEEMGYFHEQSTKPQTLGYGLADSPVALLAWIYEKLVGWTDKYEWTEDEIFTWISIYYFSRSGPAASVRIYRENHKSGNSILRVVNPISVPIGFSYFPKEILRFPKAWTQRAGNVVFEKEHAFGGHFAAYEKPKELAEDLRAMFGIGGPCFGVVAGKTGYA